MKRSLLISSLLTSTLAIGCVAEFHDDPHDDWSDDWDQDNRSGPRLRDCPNDTTEPPADTCPDPASAIFLSEDTETCSMITFECPADHEIFNVACGCGCLPTEPPEVTCPSEEDPLVTYLSRDSKVCSSITFTCPAENQQFNLECGCGCIAPEMPPQCPDQNDPNVHYLGTDREVCDKITFTCPDECVSFDDSCGCGCIEP